MSTRYKYTEKYAAYFVTFSVVEWVDVFTRNEYRKIFTDSLSFCIANKGLNVHGWVLMTNHAHLIISLDENVTHTLSDVLRDLKKFTAMQILKNITENERESRRKWMINIFSHAGKNNSNNTNFQFWQQDNHPIMLNSDEKLGRAMEYIHNNPVKAGIVDLQEEYIWSSSRDYSGNFGIVPVCKL
jgi:REP element-mobilizing transposase RayT